MAENAGLNAEDVVSALYKAHGEGNTDAGVDIESESSGVTTAGKGIKDSFAAKDWAIKLATEAAISVLRVDSIIVSKQAGIAPPKQTGNWDED